MSKVLGIQEKNFFKLVERMNKFSENNKVIATQVFPKPDEDFWYALIYYDNQSERANPYPQKSSKEVKDAPATQGQLDFLKRLGYKGTLNLSKKEAWRLAEELK